MKKTIVLSVVSVLVVASVAVVTVLTASAKKYKVEELMVMNAADENATEEVIEEESEAIETVNDEVKDNAEEVKKEEDTKNEVVVKQESNNSSNSTSTPSNNANVNTQKSENKVKNEENAPRLWEVVPTPEGEVYYTTMNGVPLTVNERRLINVDGFIKCYTNPGFYYQCRIHDPNVVISWNNYKEYLPDGSFEDCWKFKGMKKGKTRVTMSYIEAATGELRYNTEYYLEVDENLNINVFIPGNGVEN